MSRASERHGSAPTGGKPAGKQISFRIDGAALADLEARAADLGVSAGVCARQLVVDALRVAASPAGPPAWPALGGVLTALADLRRDMLAGVTVLLVDAGKAEPEEARAFVKAHFGVDPSEAAE